MKTNRKVIVSPQVLITTLGMLLLLSCQTAKADFPDVRGYCTAILSKIEGGSGNNAGPYPVDDFLPDGRTTLKNDIAIIQSAATGDDLAAVNQAIASVDRLRYFPDDLDLTGVKTLERDLVRLRFLASHQ